MQISKELMKIMRITKIIIELFKLLLATHLIFIPVRVVTGQDSLTETCREDMQTLYIRSYNIELTPYINEDYKNTNIYWQFKSYIDEQRAKDNFVFYGEATIHFRFRYKLNKICLHVQNLEIDGSSIKLFPVETDLNDEPYIPRITYNNGSQILVLYYDNVNVSDTFPYHLSMKFVGSITDVTGGFIKILYINNKGEKKWVIAAADFQGAGARQIFPCWDEPYIKNKFIISIKHHRNYTALSNFPIDEEIIDDNGMFWTRFNTTVAISPYQIAVVLAELDHIPDTNVWCRKDVERQTKFAQEVAENVKLDLKRIFYNVQFPNKIYEVLIPGFRDEGVESWGLILYRETNFIYDENLDSIGWKFEVARMVARKIAHQFFGNLVIHSLWSHLWLNEGIATFLAMRIVNQYVHSNLTDLFAVQFQHECLRLNEYYNMSLEEKVIDFNSPYDINSLFSFTYYIKAPVLVRTLLQKVPVNAIVMAFYQYLMAYQLAFIDTSSDSSTTDQFFYILQGVLKDLNESNTNLVTKLSYWTKQKRYPVLQVTRQRSNKVKIKLLQEYPTEFPEDMWIFVTYITQTAPNNTKTKWISSNQPILDLSINQNDWIIVNIKETGYYRVNYDKKNWQKLVDYLNSTEYLNIHVLNRAQIIDDAYYFLLNNKLDSRIFKNLTYYLSNERNYVAWYPMFKIMEEISGFFPLPESTEVKEHFRKIFESVLGDVGYINNITEDVFTKCLRVEAAKWACTLNSSQCMTAAIYELMWLYRMPKSIMPGWKEWIHCKGLMSAHNDLWLEVLHAAELNKKVLKFLACSENQTIIIDYINRLKSGYFTEAQDRITIFHSIVARHAKNDLVLNYILNNFENVVPSEIKTIVALTDIINHLYSGDQVGKIYNFAQNNFFNDFKMFTKVDRKTNLRLREIKKSVCYFQRILKTK